MDSSKKNSAATVGLIDSPPSPTESDIPAEVANELTSRAASIAREVEASTGSDEMEVIDSVATVGLEAQRQGGREVDRLRMRVAEMLRTDGVSSQVTKDLISLRMELAKLAPSSNAGPSKIIRSLPFAGGAARQLERIAIRYETVSKQVVTIERRLAEGRALLHDDNTQLRELYRDVEGQRAPIARNIFLGNAIVAELEAVLARTGEPRKRERVQTLLFDLAMRIQDLHTMREVHEQFFVSIELTRVNNSRLSQAIDRTLSLTTSTLTVGLALQSALSNQRRVLDANRRTREFLGDLVVANAASIKQQAKEIGDAAKEPVIALEKLEQAHRDLEEAIEIAARLEVEGTAQAKANIQRLEEMTHQLSRRSTALLAEPTAQKSLEA